MTDTSARVLAETQRRRRGHLFYPPQKIRRKIPALYATEAIPVEDTTIWLHYFGGPYDAWIAECNWHEGLAFGFVRIHGNGNGEWGLVDLAEAEALSSAGTVTESVGAGPTFVTGTSYRIPGLVIVERDLWWEPKPFSQVAL